MSKHTTIVLVFCLLILFFNNLEGQSDIIFSFGKHPWKCNNTLLDSALKKYNNTDSIYFLVPITLWVYPQKNGFRPGFHEIKQVINDLNLYYTKINHIGVRFYLAQIKIVHSNSHQTISYLFENFFLTLLNHTPGTINIHLVNKISYNFIVKKNEFGGLYNSLTHSIIITRSDLGSGLAHEVGHYFGLLHTHRNWNKGKHLAEAVSRNMKIDKQGHKNCECRGDYLCDTPAEPDLSLFMDYSCHYMDNAQDPWGNKYKPLTDNIMSYQPNPKCRKHFTAYQRAAILLSLERSKYYKYWHVSRENISFNPDCFEPDDFIQISSLLEPFVKQYHTFNLIFTSHRLLEDKNDFFRYIPVNHGRTFLVLSKGKYAFPIVKIVLYDNFYNKIFSKYIDSPTVIELPNTSSSVCYIKLESLQQLYFGQLFDYYVELQQF